MISLTPVHLQLIIDEYPVPQGAQENPSYSDMPGSHSPRCKRVFHRYSDDFAVSFSCSDVFHHYNSTSAASHPFPRAQMALFSNNYTR